MKNFKNWPAWIPNPNAWMSAIVLLLLAWGTSVALQIISILGASTIFLPVKLRILLYYLALLSPIAVIAVAHHWLHIALDRFFPDSDARSPEMAGTSGLFPGLMSWWEGLYGWLAIGLALIVNSLVELMFYRNASFLSNPLNWWKLIGSFWTISTAVRIVTAAYLYQFDYLVRDRLIAIGAASAAPAAESAEE